MVLVASVWLIAPQDNGGKVHSFAMPKLGARLADIGKNTKDDSANEV